jgi:predicted DNA repair protein MutK
MEPTTSEFFSKANIQLMCVGGFYVAFFGFAKYMEYREVQKAAKDRHLKKSQNNDDAEKDDLVEVPPFHI